MLDYSWLWEPYYYHLILAGLRTTLLLSFCGMFLAFALGVLGAMVLHFRVPILYGFTGTMVELLRNTPPLVQLFFLYFTLSELGLTVQISGHKQPLFGGFACVVLMCGAFYGAAI